MSGFARGGVIPGCTASDDRVPVWLDNSYVVLRPLARLPGMAYLSARDETGKRRRQHVMDSSSLAVAIQRAGSVVGLQVLSYQAEVLAEAAGIWASGSMEVRSAAQREVWAVEDYRAHLRQEMRFKLLDKITREGYVPVSLPAETLHYTKFPYGGQQDEADPTPPPFSMPEGSDWDQVIVVLEVGIRRPAVDRAAAVRAGILGG